MENKVNIAYLLKDCPQGTEFYSPIFGKVYLEKIRPHLAIVVTTDKEQGDFKEEFLYDGRYGTNGECMLFPSKDQRDWNKFHIPFKDGDIVATEDGSWIGITTGGGTYESIPTYCVIKRNGKFKAYLNAKDKWAFDRLATEEEKQKLFDVIKTNGYKWNAETKTLERLIEPKFKVGDKIGKDGYEHIILEIKDTHYIPDDKSALPFTFQDEYELVPDEIKPKFKVGDKIKKKGLDDVYAIEIATVGEGIYTIKNGGFHYIESVDKDYELVPSKFDISTFKPFESKVLVRDSRDDMWRPAIFGCFNGKTPPYYVLGGIGWKYCIPYEGNEHLLGKDKDCDEYYKIW